MILLYELSEDNKELCGLGDGEEIYYCLPLDIDLKGDYRSNSYTVMTNRRLLILEEGKLTREFQLAECDSIHSEPQIACGILFVEKGGEQILLGRFTAKHLTRYSYLSRGMLILKRGRTERVVSHEYEKSCPKCGRGLPNTSECPRCSGKSMGFFKDYMMMVKPHTGTMIVILLLMLLSTAVGLLSPQVQRYLVDDLLTVEGRRYGEALPCLPCCYWLWERLSSMWGKITCAPVWGPISARICDTKYLTRFSSYPCPISMTDHRVS